jgi:disulfide oxidoreductase YuzD
MAESVRKEAEATQARENAAAEKEQARQAREAAEEAVAGAEAARKSAVDAANAITQLSWTQARVKGHSPLTTTDMIYMLILQPAKDAQDKEKEELKKAGKLTKPMKRSLENRFDAL